MKVLNYRSAPIIGLMLTLLGTACGGGDHGGHEAGDVAGGDEADRVVDVAMTDNAFNPSSITVSSGETVTFRFTNNGAVAHEAFIGDAKEQAEHGESMESGEHTEGHDMAGGDALVLKPGDKGDLTYAFEEAGEILIGCHQPGHYEAGMKSTVAVS